MPTLRAYSDAWVTRAASPCDGGQARSCASHVNRGSAKESQTDGVAMEAEAEHVAFGELAVRKGCQQLGHLLGMAQPRDVSGR